MKNKSSVLKHMILAVLPFLSILLLLCIWLMASNINPELVPPPSAMVSRLIQLFYEPVSGYNLFGHIWFSLRRVVIALCFSVSIGLCLGILIGWNRYFKLTIGSLFEIIRPIPPIAWLPLVVMWFGIAEFPKIVLVFIGTLMPVVINTYTGIRMVDERMLSVGKSFQASQWQLLTEVAIPSALPSICAGLRNAVGTGWMVVLAAEMIGAKTGVGFLITRGMNYFDIPLILVGMLAIGIVGALLSAIIEFIERRICPWAFNKGSD